MNPEKYKSAISFRNLRFKLESAGFVEVFQLGNHAKFVRRSPDSLRSAILPHYKEISPCVVRSVLRQSGLSEEEFERL